jgi:hypothetical protein
VRVPCDYCREPIRWFRTAANHTPIPVDAEPDSDGNLVRLSDGTMAVIPKASQREAMREQGRTFWMPHVASCPKKDEWNRPKPRAAARRAAPRRRGGGR